MNDNNSNNNNNSKTKKTVFATRKAKKPKFDTPLKNVNVPKEKDE